MPEIKFKHISSVSSEDKKHPAENLLASGDFKTWKSATPGEKSVSVLIQLDKAEQIHQIDIGNNHSGFIEVLVGKSTTKNEEYQVLLVASSFMSPAESRSGTNATRVRIFTKDKLAASVRDQKWDSVKVVCTQPFTKSVQYGLSFINLHSPAQDGTPSTPAQKQMKLGAFRIKDEGGDDIGAGALFAKKNKPPPPLTGAAAVREAARLADQSQPTTSFNSKQPDQSKPSTPQRTAVPDKPKAQSTTPFSNTTKRKASQDSDIKADKAEKPPLSRRTSADSHASEASFTSRPPPLKRTKTEPPKKSAEKAFSSLMSKVVFVMSGYENPERGKIRDKAMEMGAEYRPGWNNRTCTHLICAFPNTPKYNEVKGKGRIVDKDWILDCYRKRRLLPWRKYRVGRARTPDDSTESDTDEEYSPVQKRKQDTKGRSPRKNIAEDNDRNGTTSKANSSINATPQKHEPDLSRGEPSSSRKRSITPKAETYADSTDMDTDEEIERMKAESSKQEKKESPAKIKTESKTDEFDADTDQELPSDGGGSTDVVDSDENISKRPNKVKDRNGDASPSKNSSALDDIEELPDFFTDKKFLLYGSFDADDRRLLKRYIVTYNGVVEEYMGPTIKFVITHSKWDDNFDKAVTDNPNLIFVKPAWIYACHEQQKLLPHQRYVITP